MSESVKKLVYKGPAQQVCYELAHHGYKAVLVPDAVYELPTEFADVLMASNPNFRVAPHTAFVFPGSSPSTDMKKES